jgi:selenocysteine lyase/cysteine desulfurase
LAIFGFVKEGMTVLTTENEHNSVLRPLYALNKQGIINLLIEPATDGYTPFERLAERGKSADLLVVSNVSNVLGAVVDVKALKHSLKDYPVKILVDGAQGVPYVDIDGKCADMIALPAHKGLHGIQGVGALLFNKDISLKPLIYGGTGTESFSAIQPETIPDGLESGTLFSGGIRAFHEGARWTFEHVNEIRHHIETLAKECAYGLKHLGAKVYNNEFPSGIVTFNVYDVDSQSVATYLDQRNIAVRGGVHCAPLIHQRLKTHLQGAVRVSFGVDNNEKDIISLLGAVEKFMGKIKNPL